MSRGKLSRCLAQSLFYQTWWQAMYQQNIPKLGSTCADEIRVSKLKSSKNPVCIFKSALSREVWRHVQQVIFYKIRVQISNPDSDHFTLALQSGTRPAVHIKTKIWFTTKRDKNLENKKKRMEKGGFESIGQILSALLFAMSIDTTYLSILAQDITDFLK